MALARRRAVRGALAGALAAGIWSLQTPLDKRLFGVDYDDVELLGKALTRGRGWRPLGVAMHVGNGALFGAAYAGLSARAAGAAPGWALGTAAALVEHVAAWPLLAVTERVHPARDELPRVATSPRAFLQATWRHALFGAILGAVEERLNRPRDAASEERDDASAEVDETLAPWVSRNGHGDIRRAASEQAADS
jgi:hypothetical protein